MVDVLLQWRTLNAFRIIADYNCIQVLRPCNLTFPKYALGLLTERAPLAMRLMVNATLLCPRRSAASRAAKKASSSGVTDHLRLLSVV